MTTMKKAKWSLALALSLFLGLPAFAQTSGEASDMDLDSSSATSEPVLGDEIGDDLDSDLYDDSDATSTLDADADDPDTNVIVTDEPSRAAVAPAAAETRAGRPDFAPAGIRVIPAVGAASFTTSNQVSLENFDQGFSAGVFVDIGSRTWQFETGVLALNTQGNVGDAGSGNFDVNSWGIPLMAKVNFSGNPNSTVFLKAGVLPFQPDVSGNDFEIMGSAALGGAIPLFTNTALTLEAQYNRILDDTGSLGSYQGVAGLVGLSFGL